MVCNPCGRVLNYKEEVTMHLLINTDSTKLHLNSIHTVCMDPPYNSTQNPWDKEFIDCIQLVIDWNISDTNIVTTSDMRYAASLISKHPQLFSHDLVWEKTVGSGQLNIKNRPLRMHENILVFKIGKPGYNRLKTPGEPYRINRKILTKQCYGEQRQNERVNDGERDAKTILKVRNPRIKGGHPTQKPVELFQILCDMYNPAEGIIVDPFCGSGTILDVVNHTTIGVEKDDGYYQSARASREGRICEVTPELIAYFEQFIPNLEGLEYTMFIPKGA